MEMKHVNCLVLCLAHNKDTKDGSYHWKFKINVCIPCQPSPSPGCAGLIVAQVQRSKPLAERESQQPQSWLCRSSDLTASQRLPWPWRIPLEFGSPRVPEDCLIAFRCELIHHRGTQSCKKGEKKVLRHEEGKNSAPTSEWFLSTLLI